MKKILFFLNEYSYTATFLEYLKTFQNNNFETRVFKFRNPRLKKDKLKYLKSFWQEIKNFKPDFIYIGDELFTKNTLFIVFLKKLFFRGLKIISFVASQYIPNPTFLNKIRLNFLLKNIDFLFCRNKKELKRIKNINLFKNYSNLHHLYWGISKELFHKINQSPKDIVDYLKPLKRKYPEIKNKYILGFVGRVVPEKGLDNLLNSLKKLPNSFILLYAGQVGNSNYNQRIKELIKNNNIRQRVIYLGSLKNENLKYLYNSLDLLVVPTTSQPNGFIELFGAVLVEAMFCQTLVIGSNNGAIPEILNRQDLVFKENDPEDLLKTINYIYNLKKEEKEKIINGNYKRAIKEFGSECFVKNMINILLTKTPETKTPRNSIISYCLWKIKNQFKKIPRTTKIAPLYLKFLLKGGYRPLRIFTHLTIEEKNTLYNYSKKLKNGSNIAEIGSYFGASASFLALGNKLNKIFCVDPWKNETMPEGLRDTFPEFKNNTKKFNNITALRGRSEDVAKNFNRKIDLLFIDGDHSYKEVKIDVCSWIPKCKNEAIVILHDIGWAEGVNRVIEEDIKPIEKKILEKLPNMYITQIKKDRGKSTD